MYIMFWVVKCELVTQSNYYRTKKKQEDIIVLEEMLGWCDIYRNNDIPIKNRNFILKRWAS
jgi:hypothetical protein